MFQHIHAHADVSFTATILMWQAMMAAMMAPVLLPWARAFGDLAADAGRGRRREIASFASVYFSVWLGYSLAAAAAQVALQRFALLDRHLALGSISGGILLVAAGLVQSTSLKQSCLAHCRNPLTYFLARWRNGPTGGFRLGLAHGTFCVGCCWALMATAFALGVMNLLWMAVLTAIVCVEQLAPQGDRIGKIAGVAMIAAGLLTLYR